MVHGSHLVHDLHRAERAGRLASGRLAEAEQAMIESIRRDGNIETLSFVYSIEWDRGPGRFRLVRTAIPYRGYQAEDVA
jgi:hypothetical protein